MVDAILAEGGPELICTVANDNDPSQVVISGHRLAIEKAITLAKDLGAKRAVLLPVSAPFHCPLMQPAAEAMEAALLEADLRAPLGSRSSPTSTRPPSPTPARSVTCWCNRSPAWSAGANRSSRCTRQVSSHFVEFGGKVLSPMVKRITPDVETTSVITMDDIEEFVKKM